MPSRAEDVVLNAVISAIWKGQTGSGKTIASCGKEFRPVYVFDFEGRMDSVVNYYKRLDGHCRDIEFDTFAMGDSWRTVDARMEELAASCPYRSVSIASLTSYIHFVLKHTIQAKVGVKRQSGQQAGKNIAGIPVNELEDFNAEDAAIIFELISFLQQLKDMGVNVFIEAHITPIEIKTGTGQNEKITTLFQILTKGKKAPAQIPGYFNEVYLFEKRWEGIIVGQGTNSYHVDTRGNSANDCKSSMGVSSFDWTNLDFSVELTKQFSRELKDAPRAVEKKALVSF
jgi:hypothetical protein